MARVPVVTARGPHPAHRWGVSPRIERSSAHHLHRLARAEPKKEARPAAEVRRAEAKPTREPTPYRPATGGATARRGDMDAQAGLMAHRLQSAPTSSAAKSRSSDSPSGPERFQIGSYNVGGGNEEARKPENFEKTKALIGEKAASGEVDVLALQEVDRNTDRAGGKDQNVEVLREVFEGELGEDWEDAEIEERRIDDRTIELVATKDGEERTMRITQSAYTEDGQPREWGEDERPDVIRYEAEISGNPPRTYNMIYGESIHHDGGQYGNAVLLGPGYEPTRFGRQHIGQDPDSSEKRSALAVEVRTPDGRQVGVVSTHLTSGATDGAPEEREDQYVAVDEYAEEFFGSTPTVIAGDFNSKAGGSWRYYVREHHYPSADELGWRDPDPSREAIDRTYTTGDVRTEDRHIHRDVGGSDHDLVTWNVELG